MFKKSLPHTHRTGYSISHFLVLNYLNISFVVSYANILWFHKNRVQATFHKDAKSLFRINTNVYEQVL